MQKVAEKRIYGRIPVDLKSRFSHGNIFSSGTIMNLSKKSMFIKTMNVIPVDSVITVILHTSKELFQVFAKVKRLNRTAEHYDGMGVEIISSNYMYLKYVKSLEGGL
jgi:hypothetical protein